MKTEGSECWLPYSNLMPYKQKKKPFRISNLIKVKKIYSTNFSVSSTLKFQPLSR